MSTLNQIHHGRRHTPPRLLVFGTEGIGKSTLAAAAPKPIFVRLHLGLIGVAARQFHVLSRVLWQSVPFGRISEEGGYDRQVLAFCPDSA